jgi:cell fate (sporulation/competence/biofilm development) regulator YlbF (YheA/YmcA/DUF963 family)
LADPVKADPAAEKLLAQFRLKQLELQATALQGQPTPQQQAAFQQLIQQLQARPVLKQYMDAEQAYADVLAEVHKVLGEVFQPDVPGAIRE